jgi:hypothetical protein
VESNATFVGSERQAAAGPPWDLPALVEAISREIGARAKGDRFRQQVLARLREH